MPVGGCGCQAREPVAGGCGTQPGDVGGTASPGDQAQVWVLVKEHGEPGQDFAFLAGGVGPPGVVVRAVRVDQGRTGQPDVVVAGCHVVFEVDGDVGPGDRPPGAWTECRQAGSQGLGVELPLRDPRRAAPLRTDLRDGPGDGVRIAVSQAVPGGVPGGLQRGAVDLLSRRGPAWERLKASPGGPSPAPVPGPASATA